MEACFDQMDQRFDQLDRRFVEMNAKWRSEIELRRPRLDQRS